MIWPWSFEWKGWQALTVTLALVGMNLFFFVLSKDFSREVDPAELVTVDDLALTAKLYHQYLGKPGVPKPEAIPPLVGKALGDADFIRLSPSLAFRGDQVAIRKWKQTWSGYHQYLRGRAMKVFGYSFDRNGWANAISYQFVHANFFHLASNLVLLFLFGGAVELMLGGLWTLGIYLIGGVLGGLFYLRFAEPTLAPMVGASVSVSALIGFYVFAERRSVVRYMYFLSPLPGYFGEIWLSKWALVPLFLLSDVSALLKPGAEAATVAHLGHLGGLLFGVVIGAAVAGARRLAPDFENAVYEPRA